MLANFPAEVLCHIPFAVLIAVSLWREGCNRKFNLILVVAATLHILNLAAYIALRVLDDDDSPTRLLLLGLSTVFVSQYELHRYWHFTDDLRRTRLYAGVKYGIWAATFLKTCAAPGAFYQPKVMVSTALLQVWDAAVFLVLVVHLMRQSCAIPVNILRMNRHLYMIAVCVGILFAVLQFVTGQERFVGFVSFLQAFSASLHAMMPPAEQRKDQELHSVRSRDGILGATDNDVLQSGWYDGPSATHNKLAKSIHCFFSRLSR
ncbi:predicted protein [Uncinocarpus reesii 1704]|uniref:Uncharacterized protein n=1 Tax=Uncinocarpus reesii (strain UAMH 1704) TaxID=336963 RepID=C4K095_UNCRE|nr:uncharacterized protein UREG_07909 [Uncinocarpus reesii 1704]EEP83044.1 predicted protein [Uncinocarpus reesii 1704]